MSYQIKILLISFIATVVFAILILPILKKLKVSQIEREEGPQSHLKKQGTPTMGGIIMMLGVIAVSILVFLEYYKSETTVAKNIIPILLISLGFGFIGFIDDFKKLILKNTKGLKPSYKMIGLLLISVLYVVYLLQFLDLGTETYIPFLKTYINLPIWIYIPFAIFVMLATTNAINLTDGVDGLATSVTTIIVTCLTVIGIIYNVKELVIFGSMVCGSCLAFLLFNLNPAKVFMGDTGSLFLGGVVVSMALYLQMPLLLIIIALIPVLETLSVMIQVLYYKKTGKRVFKMAPLHHHFELSGWNENKVVSIFSIVTLLLCILGLNVI